MDVILNWIIENDKKFYYFSLFMSVPSTILYIGEMFAILCNKKHRGNSFFQLFCVRGISDILMLAASCYGNRLPSLFGSSLLSIYRALPNWSLALFYFSTTFTYQVTNIATFFMILNRFTAIAFPLNHQKIWKKFFWLLIMIMLVVPALTCFPIMQMDATLSTTKDDGTFVIMENGTTKTFLDYANKLKCLNSIVFLILCFFVNLLTLIAYKRHLKTTNNLSQQNDAIERKLLIYSLFTFGGHALLALFFLFIWAVIWPIFPQYNAIIYIQYPWTTDLCTLVLSSWILLCTSSRTFRHELIDAFWPIRSSQTSTRRAQNNVITVKPYQISNI